MAFLNLHYFFQASTNLIICFTSNIPEIDFKLSPFSEFCMLSSG